MSSEINIKIKHIEKFMKRTDIKKLHWFAFEVSLFKHPDFKKVTPQEKLMFLDIIGIFVMCKKDEVRLDLEFMDFEYHHPKGTCLSTIKKLDGKQWDIVSRSESEQTRTDLSPTGQDRTLQDTTGQDSTLLSSGDDIAPLPKFAIIWNENCSKLPVVKSCSEKRMKKIKTVMKEVNEENFLEAVKKAAASDFCNGKSNTGWIATFDFFLDAENVSKTLEGKYDNREKFNNTRASQAASNNKRLLEKYSGATERTVKDESNSSDLDSNG